MKIKIRPTLLLMSTVLLLSAKGSEPVDSYLSALVEGVGENLWWVYPQEIEGHTVTPPKGGYMFRIQIDLNGDGLDEVFLTADAEIGKNGASWTLYRGDTSNHYTKLNDNVWIGNLLWVKSDDGVKKYSYLVPQDRETTIEEIHSFWIDLSGNYQTSTQQLTTAQSKAINGVDKTLLNGNDLPDDTKVAQYLGMGDPVTLNIQKVLVGKLYQNANATWRAVNNSYALSQQYLDPADAADIASLGSWVPPSNP